MSNGVGWFGSRVRVTLMVCVLVGSALPNAAGEPEGWYIHGQVVSSEGKPLAGVLIRASCQTVELVAEALTDEEGGFSIRVPSEVDEYTVWGQVEGYLLGPPYKKVWISSGDAQASFLAKRVERSLRSLKTASFYRARMGFGDELVGVMSAEAAGQCFYSQRDPRWSGSKLGTSAETIGSAGCAVACVAMLHKWESGSTNDPDPGQLNTWLTANGGYASGNLIIWSVAANYDGAGGLTWIGSTSGTDGWTQIDAELAAGRKPIVLVDSTPTTPDLATHFVIVYERVGTSGVASSYRILDPWDTSFNAYKTLNTYRDPSSGFTAWGLRKYGGNFPSSSTGGTIRLTVNSSSGSALPVVDMNCVMLFNSAQQAVADRTPPSSNPVDFTGIAYGDYYVFVFCWDMLAAESGTFSHNSSITSRTFNANRTKRPLTVTVYRIDGSTRLSGATVCLDSRNGQTGAWTQRASATTDANGQVSISAWPTTVSGERYQVRVNYAGNQVGSNGTVTVLDNPSGSSYSITTTVSPPDTTPPTITAFNVSPSSASVGTAISIAYTARDTGSGLKTAQLWRARDTGYGVPGTFEQVGPTVDISVGGNGPYNGSFSDTPPLVGVWWYGVHINDGANPSNWNDEKNSQTGGLPGVFGPKQVTVTAAHSVSAPSTPSGTTNGSTGSSYTYATGGSSCSQGHAVQYRFNWGDGTYSPWSPSTSASRSWATAGTYLVRAEARCGTDTSIVSGPSAALAVTISAPHSVSAPSTPSGTTNGSTGSSYTYATGGSSCSQGHAVQYRFNWGDGTYSPWSPSTSASRSWATAGTYLVRAEARCGTDTSIVSGPSAA
ncbi:MAG: carboxypeptidase regulatory-like domain-containing protein, partial [Planctomycetes bacterium]|nr:carboxypeptidase regulatory-like domain-containing protein [Planctomycetota bacterium]